ncbi:MAG TPA: enoyl-CoA hydratase-related protein [Acidimicrobiales bacterium]|nr:enoyl-CoA hydratase-related protein [Acidimicrobiales bacterium]
MSEQFVTVDRRDDGVAVVRLDRPKMNALSPELLEQLEAAAKELAADPPGAVVVWGGERLFAAGADISRFGGPDEARVVGALFVRALEALEAIPRATIAAITGYALGGGCELALGCDFRLVADNAKLGQPEVLLGIIPGGGGTQRLPRLVGPSRAKDLLYSGRQVDAAEALRIGLVDRVVPAAEVLDAALAWAGELARGAVVAQGLMKQAVQRGLDGSLADGMAVEQDAFVESFRTDDATIGIKSFLENGPGKATFTGR